MRNEFTLTAILNELQRNCGDSLAACKAVGVSLMFLNQWRKDDKEVNDQCAEAERVGTQGLVSAAIQRAVRGVEEDVYYKGTVVGQKTNYSDGLLQTLLKAKVPEFAKEGEGSGVNVQVNVANLMPRAESYQQWLTMKEQTLAISAPETSERDSALEALGRVMTQPPPDVIDAEFTPISVFAGVDL